jgi:hypothetical protein
METRLPIIAALPAIAGIAGAGASIYGAVNNANAVGSASKAQQQAYQQSAANYQPYLGAGQAALQQQLALLGLGGSGTGGSNPAATPNYAAYVQNNPDILAAYNAGNGNGATMDQFGQWHWNTFGQNEVNSGDPNRAYTPFGPAGANGASTGGPGGSSAIDALKNSPLYQALYHNGEQAVLANGAATGGLRGGNTQASLYNLGVNTLAQTQQQMFNQLGSLSGLGENAAAGVGNGLTGAAAAQAGGILGSANANNSLASSIAGLPSVLGNSSVLSSLGLGNSGGISGLGTLANAPAGVQQAFDGLF